MSTGQKLFGDAQRLVDKGRYSSLYLRMNGVDSIIKLSDPRLRVHRYSLWQVNSRPIAMHELACEGHVDQ